MTYVHKIIDAFGGVRPMAARLGLPPTTVSSWKARGTIPDRQKPMVLAAARIDGYELGPADFFPSPFSDEDAA